MQAQTAGHHVDRLVPNEAQGPQPHSPSASIPVPATQSSSHHVIPHFPTFRFEPSFKLGDVLARAPIQVLERDEVGLIDALVEEELLQWSDEEEETEDGLYSRSPDSDGGHELTTGESVMEGISKAFSMQRASDSVSPGREPRAGDAAAGYERPEDAQAAALLGQPSYDSAEPRGEQDGNGTAPKQEWSRGGMPRRGATASSHSTSSIEEALRIHNLSLQSPFEGPSTSDRTHSSSGSGASSRGASPTWSGSINGSGEAASGPLSPTTRLSLPFTARNAPLLRVIPKFYGVQVADGRVLLELEDLARWYHHPCIIDIKIGHQTWYPHADPAYIERCKKKDAATTQSTLGFKICGMQVYRHGRGGYWRASKRWCKTLPELLVDKALTSFAHNGKAAVGTWAHHLAAPKLPLSGMFWSQRVS